MANYVTDQKLKSSIVQTLGTKAEMVLLDSNMASPRKAAYSYKITYFYYIHNRK